jgi:hypothetical protein
VARKKKKEYDFQEERPPTPNEWAGLLFVILFSAFVAWGMFFGC